MEKGGEVAFLLFYATKSHLASLFAILLTMNILVFELWLLPSQ